MIAKKQKQCWICERDFYSNKGRYPVGGPTKHHITPKQKYHGKWKDAEYEYICVKCHRQINKMFTNNELKELGKQLKDHPKIKKWKKWIRKE